MACGRFSMTEGRTRNIEGLLTGGGSLLARR